MAKFVFVSEKGEREKQEDFYGSAEDEFFVVADGLGGHPAGEVAAEAAVETAVASYKETKRPRDRETEKQRDKVFIENIFKKTNDVVYQKAKEKSEWIGMGTTMVVVLLQSWPQRVHKAIIGNVGDSRAYIFSTTLKLITEDDRYAGYHLSQALGTDERVEPHIYEIKPPQKGDILLLCTDGLTDFVGEEIIEKILASDKGLKEKAQGLVEAALQFGSTDNVTVGLIQTQ